MTFPFFRYQRGVRLNQIVKDHYMERMLQVLGFIVKHYLMAPSGKPIKNPIPYLGDRFRVCLLNVIPFPTSAPTDLLLLYALLRGLKGCHLPQLKRRVSDDCKIHQHPPCVKHNCFGLGGGPFKKRDIVTVTVTLLLSDEHSVPLCE